MAAPTDIDTICILLPIVRAAIDRICPCLFLRLFCRVSTWMVPRAWCGDWCGCVSLLYASLDQSTVLRDEPNQNYLRNGLRIMGYTLMSIAFFGAIASALWVHLRWNNHTLVHYSPYSLSYCIWFWGKRISYINNIKWWKLWMECRSIEYCMYGMSLVALMYTSLYSKLWRINKVLPRFRPDGTHCDGSITNVEFVDSLRIF
jgi:hypothetical protein